MRRAGAEAPGACCACNSLVNSPGSPGAAGGRRHSGERRWRGCRLLSAHSRVNSPGSAAGGGAAAGAGGGAAGCCARNSRVNSPGSGLWAQSVQRAAVVAELQAGAGGAGWLLCSQQAREFSGFCLWRRRCDGRRRWRSRRWRRWRARLLSPQESCELAGLRLWSRRRCDGSGGRRRWWRSARQTARAAKA